MQKNRTRIIVIAFCALSITFFLLRTGNYFLPAYQWKMDFSTDFSGQWWMEMKTEEARYVDLPEDIKSVKPGQWIILKKRLTHEEREEYDKPCLMVGSSQQEFYVKLGDEILYHSDGMAKINFGRTSGCAWFLVPIPKDSAEEELMIAYRSTYKLMAGRLPAVYLGDKNELQYEQLVISLWDIIVGAVLIFFALAIFGVSWILHRESKQLAKSGIYLGLLFLTLGAFILIESQAIAFFVFNYALNYYIEFVSMLAFMIFIYRFIYYFYSPECKGLIWRLGDFHLLLLIIALLGQLIGLTDFFNFQWVALGGFGATILIANFFLVKEIKTNKKIRELFLWLIVLFLLVLFSIFLSRVELEMAMWDVLLVLVTVFELCFLTQFFWSLPRIFRVQAENQVLKEEIQHQITYYEKMGENKKATRKYMHDMKYQWFTLEQLLKKGQIEEAKEHIRLVREESERGRKFLDTGNYLLDAIVSEKLWKVEQLGTKIEWCIAVKKDLQITSSDCSALFGNLFDNALEALRKVEPEQRELELKIMSKQNLLLIKMKNTYAGELKKEGDHYLTTKNETDWHGIGLESVATIVKAYKGELELSHDDTCFYVGIILYGV